MSNKHSRRYAPRLGRDPIAQLERLAKEKGLTVVQCAPGHFQLRGGPLLVNWWPLSKRSTAYVDGTRDGVANAKPEDVIRMATTAPMFVGSGDERRTKSTRKWKIRKLREQPNCHWCLQPMTLEDCTKEHVIPLARGGLDNNNNSVLAHRACNEARGHDMPELKSQATQPSEAPHDLISEPRPT